jgi:F-type H+-transporting ATPase subunit epsilon
VPRTPFRVEVLTPEGEVFNEEVEMVSTRTAVGSIGILAGHQPMLADLDPAELRLYRSEGDVVRFAQGEGFLQISDSGALLLIDELQSPSALDAADLRDRVSSADRRVSGSPEGSEELRVAKRDKRRYETWLKVVEKSSDR